MAKIKAKKKSTAQVILPKKMSSLIRIALADIKKAERVKTCIVNMGTWFEREHVTCETSNGTVIEEHDVCTICAAGSVMMFSLKADKKFPNAQEIQTSDFPKNQAQLEAINELRDGCVSGAASELELIPAYPSWDGPNYKVLHKAYEATVQRYEKFNCQIPDYDRDNPKPFHAALKKLQHRLAKAGL